jgi:peptide/nickel transport system substrate-binding protein
MLGKIKKVIAGSAVLALLVIGVSACSNNSDDSSSGSGGTVTIAISGDYTAINDETTSGNTAYNGSVNYFIRNLFTYFDKDLNLKVNEDAIKVEKTSDDPLTIEYTISDKAKWSDGQPVTGADLLLQWAGASTNLNDELDDSQYDEETGVAKPNEGQVYFDGGDGISQDIKKTPTISDDGKKFTVVWDKFVPSWKYGFDKIGVPAHVVGEIALGAEDPAEAANQVVEAINSKDKESLAKIANTWSKAFDVTSTPDDERLLVSAGPYQISEIVEGQYVSLKKNTSYEAGPIPKIDNVVFRIVPDADAAKQALQNKEVDIINPDSPTADLIKSVSEIDGVETKPYQSGVFEHIDLQISEKASASPFSAAHYEGDAETALKVRQAFLKALPRQDIVDKIVKPANSDAVILNSFTTLNDNASYSKIVEGNDSSQYASQDIDGAKALLKEAGVDTPVKISIAYVKEKPVRVQEFQLISEAVKKAGFEVTDGGVTNQEAGDAYSSGKYDALLFGWQLTNPDFSNSKANYVKSGQNNFTNFYDSEEDKLWDQLTQTDDLDKQVEIVTKAEKILWDKAFGAPLYQYAGLVAYNSRVKNVDVISISPQELFNFWEWEVE